MIEIINLDKVYKTAAGENVALKNINLQINDGDIFGIIGLSGAGKSTLVRCINLLEKPTSGQIIIDGVDLTTVSKKELLKMRQKIGMIFQGFNLLSQRTVLKNVLFPLEIAGVNKEEALVKAKELLALVGLSHKENAYPATLSGGEKQRVAIARALTMDPKVLLSDESTSALDPNTTQAILDLLKEINQKLGVTIIVITHEMKVIDQICNRVAIIDKSHIQETGDVNEVFINPQSQIGKELIFSNAQIVDKIISDKKIVITFDSRSTYEPVVANMILECGVAVNILRADVNERDGYIYGRMVLQIPEDEKQSAKIIAYLNKHNINYVEE